MDSEGEVLQEVNAHISAAAARFAETGDDLPVGFLCECGCDQKVWLTVREYQLFGGARVVGHDRVGAATDAPLSEPSDGAEAAPAGGLGTFRRLARATASRLQAR